MSYLVTLHVYSGRENPTWVLPDTEIEILREGIENSSSLDTPISRGLGYQGFSILESDPDSETGPRPFENAFSDDVAGSFISGQPELEDLLLWTAGEEVDDELAHLVRQEIATSPDASISYEVEALSCPPNGGSDAPSYNPGYWNNNSTTRRSNNCYNYANNRATNTFAQPGRGSGSQYTAINCSNVGAASQRDGLRRVPSFQASTRGWYTALVIWPGRDYHWYRQDNNGCWSHKPGQTHVRNTDNSGRSISDPRTCDRGPYRIFCSYYVTNCGVRIR